MKASPSRKAAASAGSKTTSYLGLRAANAAEGAPALLLVHVRGEGRNGRVANALIEVVDDAMQVPVRHGPLLAQ